MARETTTCILFYFIFFLFQLFINQNTKIILVDTLVHPSNKPVDLVFPVASISTFYKMGLFLHSTLWRRQFEGPQEVVSFFETVSSSTDLMNQILHAEDAIFTYAFKLGAKLVYEALCEHSE